MIRFNPTRSAVLGLFVGLVVALSGCDKSKDEKKDDKGGPPPMPPMPQGEPKFDKSPKGTSTLKGTIKVGDAPLATGRILIGAEKGFVPSVGIITDGAYEVKELPTGDALVYVITDPFTQMPIPILPPMMPGPGGMGPGGMPPFPGMGMGGMPPMPGMPPGKMPMPGMGGMGFPSMPMPTAPKGFEELLKFTIPQNDIELYKALHKVYSKKEGALKTKIAEGDNKFDIVLKAPAAK